MTAIRPAASAAAGSSGHRITARPAASRIAEPFSSARLAPFRYDNSKKRKARRPGDRCWPGKGPGRIDVT